MITHSFQITIPFPYKLQYRFIFLVFVMYHYLQSRGATRTVRWNQGRNFSEMVRTAFSKNERIFLFVRFDPDGGAQREGKGRWSETGSVYGHKSARPVSNA